MSIFNVNDPDYPVLNGPGFIQYTYQSPYNMTAGAQQFYYNGQTLAPSGFQQAAQPPVSMQMESRRYDAPAPTPTAQPQQFGFNQLVESRRTQGATTNPWSAQPVAPAPQQFAQPQPTFGQYQAPPQPMTYPTTPDCSALCTCHPSFDRKNVWGDQQPYNPTPAPAVNWSGVAQQPMATPQYAYVNTAPAVPYPAQPMTQPVQQSWDEIARQNFGTR